MATVDLTVNRSSGFPETDGNKGFVVTLPLDFSKQARAASDVLQVWDIPAKTFIRNVAWEVVTAEGATLTFDVGDDTDPDGFLDGIDGNAVSGGIGLTGTDAPFVLTEAAPNTITGYSAGKYYHATDTLDVTLNNAAATGKVVLKVDCVDYSGQGSGSLNG